MPGEKERPTSESEPISETGKLANQEIPPIIVIKPETASEKEEHLSAAKAELDNAFGQETKESDYALYKSAVADVISRVEAEWLAPGKSNELGLAIWGKHNEMKGTAAGKEFTIRTPHLRKGKHAFVGIVEVENPDKNSFSCVIRNNPADGKQYQENIAKHPSIADYVPKLYEITDKWVVMEKLSGLELEEVTEKFKTDAEFRRQYAHHAYDLIEKTAQEGIKLNDVKFIDGHNCMVNPHTGEIKVIEQQSLHPQTLFSPKEIITDTLFREMDQVKSRKEKLDPAEINLVFQMVEKAFANNRPEDLYIKSRVVKPTHPGYKNAWFMQNFEELSDEEHRKILNHPKMRDAYTVNFHGTGFTKTFSPELVSAVLAGDAETFDKLIREGKYIINISDKTDPRYKPEIVTDETV